MSDIYNFSFKNSSVDDDDDDDEQRSLHGVSEFFFIREKRLSCVIIHDQHFRDMTIWKNFVYSAQFLFNCVLVREQLREIEKKII